MLEGQNGRGGRGTGKGALVSYMCAAEHSKCCHQGLASEIPASQQHRVSNPEPCSSGCASSVLEGSPAACPTLVCELILLLTPGQSQMNNLLCNDSPSFFHGTVVMYRS